MGRKSAKVVVVASPPQQLNLIELKSIQAISRFMEFHLQITLNLFDDSDDEVGEFVHRILNGIYLHLLFLFLKKCWRNKETNKCGIYIL